MDALAVSAAVIQFIDFTCGLIAKGVSIHSSMTGLTIDHRELKNITASLLQSSNNIQESILQSSSDTQETLEAQRARQRLNKNERDLEKIAHGCQSVAEELMEALADLTSKGPKSRWRSFRHALKATWNEGKVQSLENRLDRYRQQMMASILNSLRHQADVLIREQSSTRLSVQRIEALQRDSRMVGDRFVEEILGGEEWKRNLIQMIHEYGCANSHKMSDLGQMKTNEGRTSNAVLARENLLRERILHKLAFRNMGDRERRICKAYEQTFKWIFDDPDVRSRPWSSFKDFLMSPDKKIYWITGKPGSGKSTLMKYIRHHPETTTLLKHWSGADQTIQAAFYFWNSGSHMQMSADGLLQTVLHDCLRQLPTRALQDVLPERWEVATLFDVDDYPWSQEEVVGALRRLIIENFPEVKFFVMIDGLDECAGNQTQLIELIRELADDTENLKLCVASRPWNNFEDAFKDRPSLRLQDLSAGDIERFITAKFSTNDGFVELQVRDHSRANELLKAIYDKAEGVFLWVHLVAQSLLEGLTNGDGLRELHNRLEELPPNLEDLYAKILESLDDRYIQHASRLFQVVRICTELRNGSRLETPHESPTLLRIALADLEDDRALRAPVEPMRSEDKLALCKNMKRKLASRCRGLIDISSHRTTWSDNDNSALYTESSGMAHVVNSDDAKGINISMAHLGVQYLHRSVRDYIESPKVWSWLVSVHEKPFDPYLPLLKAHVLTLKSLNPTKCRSDTLMFHLWTAILYAKRFLTTCSTKAQEREVIVLLDEINRATTLLISLPYVTIMHPYRMKQSGLIDEFYIPGFPTLSFPQVMAICGIHQYLEMRLSVRDTTEDSENRNNIPLVYVALQGCQLYTWGHADLAGPHYEVFKTLLRKGYDCHKPYDGCSAWDLAKQRGHVRILKLFEEYRGKPPQSLSKNGRDKCAKQEEDRVEYELDDESDALTEVQSCLKNRRDKYPEQEEDRDEYESDDESDASTEALAGDEMETNRRRHSRTSSLPMSPRRGTRRKNDHRPRHASDHRFKPHSSSAESRRNVVHPEMPSQPLRTSHSSHTQHHSLFPPASYNNSYSRSVEDDGAVNGYNRVHPSHHHHHAYNPPPRVPQSYWRRTQPGIPNPFRPMPLHPPHFLTGYQGPPYMTGQPPSPMYGGEFRSPFTLRGQYDGGYGRPRWY